MASTRVSTGSAAASYRRLGISAVSSTTTRLRAAEREREREREREESPGRSRDPCSEIFACAQSGRAK